MTPKQEERIRNKIARIRKELAADKKRWGGFYNDGRGLRYLPPGLFVKLKDYKGGLRYLQWFNRTFPDDSGYPVFLFEWTLILFKTGNLQEAENKAFRTFFSNNYLFDKFLGRKPTAIEKEENSNWETAELADSLTYSSNDPELVDFATWLENFIAGDRFSRFADEVIEIDRRLKTEPAGKTRSELVNRKYDMIKEM